MNSFEFSTAKAVQSIYNHVVTKLWLSEVINVTSHMQGRIQDFQIEEAQQIMCRQRTSGAGIAKYMYLTAGVQGPLKGTG